MRGYDQDIIGVNGVFRIFRPKVFNTMIMDEIVKDQHLDVPRPSTSRCNHCSDLRALKIDSKATAADLLFLAAAAPLSLPGPPGRAAAVAPPRLVGYPQFPYIPKGAVATARIMGFRHSPSFCGLPL